MNDFELCKLLITKSLREGMPVQRGAHGFRVREALDRLPFSLTCAAAIRFFWAIGPPSGKRNEGAHQSTIINIANPKLQIFKHTLNKKTALNILLFFLFMVKGVILFAQKPEMYYGDLDVRGRPYAKDPYVIFFQGTYWMYYSVPSEDRKEWYIGIANSNDLTHWEKKGRIKGQKGTVEEKGICAPGALVKDGVLHLFYQTYGNGKLDAICHAFSTNGIEFERDATNPIFRPKISDWSCGRAIDAEVIAYKNNYFLYYATRDPDYKIQQQGVAIAPITANFDRNSWTEVPNMPMLKPELDWEKKCIEAASCIQKGNYLYMFYAGAYNNEPQQIGVARSSDGIHWKRMSEEPFLKNGEAGAWNESESGHPNIFKAQNGRYYLFFQGNNDKGKTWYLSKVEIGWNKKGPYLKK